MRIVIDATAAISGGKVYLDRLLPQLARLSSDHEFIVFHAGDFDRVGERHSIGDGGASSGNRFQFRRVRLPFSNSDLWAGASILKMLWRLIILPAHLRRLKPALLFSNAGFGPGWKVPGVRTVIALHNSMPLRDDLISGEKSVTRRWRLKMLRRLMRGALQDCDRSIVFSEDTRGRLTECFSDLGHEPAVVHHGIDWGAREREFASNGDGLRRLGVAPPYLLYVSQFHRYKNVLRLVEAFAILSSRHPDLSLALAGEAVDGRYWREIQEALDRLKIRDRVKHIRECSRDRLISLYGSALAFVHPSLAETCSFPLLEAMAMGVPIAAARMSALPEMAGEAAIYFDPNDAVEMAETLDRLVRDESLRDGLSRRAIARATDFSWSDSALKTLRIFEEVAGSQVQFGERKNNRKGVYGGIQQ
jgi:glycosyltransferase involved in cell wall biosynthesis